MLSYFENQKTTCFDDFCLNFSIETKIKTLFLISYFNLSKKRNGTLGTWIWKEQPFIFTVYLMNHNFQTSVLIVRDNRM